MQEQKSLKDALRDLALDLSDNELRIDACEKELSGRKIAKQNLMVEYQKIVAQLIAIDQYAKQEKSSKSSKGIPNAPT